ncbi:hypothetical protein BKA63DRAFT_392147, partial [Paraphoma chrysanthemicola]
SLVGKAMHQVSDLTMHGISRGGVYTLRRLHSRFRSHSDFFEIKGHFDIDVETAHDMAKLQKVEKVVAVPDYRDQLSDAVEEGDGGRLTVSNTQ